MNLFINLFFILNLVNVTSLIDMILELIHYLYQYLNFELHLIYLYH